MTQLHLLMIDQSPGEAINIMLDHIKNKYFKFYHLVTHLNELS